MRNDLGEILPRYCVKFERQSRHSPARLWQALTEPKEVEAWMDGPAEIDLRVGGRWTVAFNEDAGDYLHGVIIDVESERRLRYAWGLSVCEWDIKVAAGGCRYTFLQNGLIDRGEGEEGLAAGWHGFLDQFEMHLDGIAFDRSEEQDRWKTRQAPYAQLLSGSLGRRTSGVATAHGEPGR